MGGEASGKEVGRVEGRWDFGGKTRSREAIWMI
jgi:hypothetical protein